MKLPRTLPPAAAPLSWKNIFSGAKELFCNKYEKGRFERELKEYFDIRHCFLVSSGKAALTIILKSLKELHPDRDQVLIPAYTCYSVPSAITRAGLKIKLCDIGPDSLDFNINHLRALLADEKILCVVPTHLFGVPADIDELRGEIKGRNIYIVEDAAQAMGAEWKGKKLGTIGDVNFFSLGRGKALSTVEGGIILTDREDLAISLAGHFEKLPGYSWHENFKLFLYSLALRVLMNPYLYWIPRSLPFLRLGETIYDPTFKIYRMSSFQKGLAREWVGKLAVYKQSRRENAAFWQCFINSGGYRSFSLELDEIPDLLRFPLEIPEADFYKRLLEVERRLGLGISPGYPDSIDGIEDLCGQFDDQNFPRAKDLARQLVTLPVHPMILKNDLTRIADMINQEEQRKI